MTRPATKTDRRTAPVRWRETGWEMRCDRCSVRGGARFWPLTEEFWDKRRLTYCRACISEMQKAAERKRAADEAYRARAAATAAAYRRSARREIAFKERLRYEREKGPITERRKQRYSERKDELNARRRERYAEARAA